MIIADWLTFRLLTLNVNRQLILKHKIPASCVLLLKKLDTLTCSKLGHSHPCFFGALSHFERMAT